MRKYSNETDRRAEDFVELVVSTVSSSCSDEPGERKERMECFQEKSRHRCPSTAEAVTITENEE
jgi:hypothetical protein